MTKIIFISNALCCPDGHRGTFDWRKPLVGVPLLSSSHFTTLIRRFFPNWPILRPAPKYTTGLQPTQPVAQSPLFSQKCSNVSKSKVPNDFHVRRETDKCSTIQRNCCRKISILGGEQWKLSPFFQFHTALKRNFTRDIVEVNVVTLTPVETSRMSDRER